MAAFALLLKSQPHKRSQSLFRSTTLSHLYSSSSSSSNNNNNHDNKDGDLPAFFTEIKSKLKQQQHQHQQLPSPFQSSPFAKQPYPSSFLGGGGDGDGDGHTPVKSSPLSNSLNDVKSLIKRRVQSPQSQAEEIRRNLSEFRRRSSHEILPLGGERKTEVPGHQAIKEGLSQLIKTVGEARGKTSSMSFNNNTNVINLTKAQSTALGSGGVSNVIGGSALPLNVFGKEMNEKEKDKGEGNDSGEEELWMNPYTVDELGKKLRDLRPPEVKGKKGGDGNWFSLSELHDRLKKVKESDDKEAAAKNGAGYNDMRKCLLTMKVGVNNNANVGPIQGFDILGPGPFNFILSPPKEHLVEKYYHPDNMSAEEKLKLELEKVRNEFKMHESDCGSTRVQIAQLTTEILHLSSILHKKDKHSRRGLLAKVQQRKKLLKYLRRTDWESYCFVLSKLGLRDNPDYKN